MSKIKQSYANLTKAVDSLENAVSTPPVEDRDYGGIIQAFISSYELTWKTLQKILQQNGIDAPFPRKVFEEAFKAGMLSGNEMWKEIIEARNRSVHTYDKEMAVKLCADIIERYVPVFRETHSKMSRFLGA